MSNSCFLAEDLPYTCKCEKTIRYNSGLGFAIEVSSGDSSAESIISLEQHICIQEDQKHNLSDSYLNSQQREREIQAELYEGQFHSIAQFGKDRDEQLKQQQLQRKPFTFPTVQNELELHNSKTSANINEVKNQKTRHFLAQNSKQKELEKKEIER